MENKKILVVDDDASFCEMLKEILEEKGAKVLVELDGEAGLNTALTEKPDLVVLDVMMPKLTGIAVLEKLRKDEWGYKVPAILLTNVNEPDAIAASMETEGPPAEYVLKIDWTLEDIADKISKLLTKQQS